MKPPDVSVLPSMRLIETSPTRENSFRRYSHTSCLPIDSDTFDMETWPCRQTFDGHFLFNKKAGIMAMKHARPGSKALVLSLIISSFGAPLMAQASIDETTLVVVNSSYKAGNLTGQSILDWISRHSPDYPPIGRNGEVSLERMMQTNRLGPLVPSQSPSLPGPPGKLPESGAPGEILRMENLLPDGTTQTWEFRWVQPSTGHGGYWATAAYSIRFPIDPVNAQ